MSVAASIIGRFADADIKLDARRELVQLISEALINERACNARTARVIGRQAAARTSPIDVAEQIAKAIEIPF
jgi:Spy/CpxP family protein refolding chaperone